MRIIQSDNDAASYRGKRLLDLLVATVVLLLFLPLIILSAGLLWAMAQESPFFIQERAGLNEKPFRIIKLKTLFAADRYVLHAVGLWLRKYSIDELPQLVNVLLGDMSLVGPRPLLIEYLPYYNAQERQRHCVRPGITGLAQVRGRNCLSWSEKFALDLWYVEHATLATDLKIIRLTAQQIFDTEYVKPAGLTEAEKFRGSRHSY